MLTAKNVSLLPMTFIAIITFWSFQFCRRGLYYNIKKLFKISVYDEQSSDDTFVVIDLSTNILPWPAYRKFFKLKSVDSNGNIADKCSLCASAFT